VNKSVALVGFESENPRYPGQDGYELKVLFNAKVRALTDETQGFWEGCLSVPGLRGFVERPKKIEVTYLDEEGRHQSLIAEGFLATVFQHELDHLEGILYIDRIKNSPGGTLLSFCEEFDHYFKSELTHELD
jgi:peptide deformylase